MDRLTAMELFVRIVETGSLSAAAREFRTTLPSVSRQLRGLEKRLNARLLNRTTRHLTLTEAGKAFYEDCRQIVESVRAAESGVGALQTSLRGVLRWTPVSRWGRSASLRSHSSFRSSIAS